MSRRMEFVSRQDYVRPLALALGWRGSLQAQVSLMGWVW